MTSIIAVDKNDEKIGKVEKLEAHLADGILHRAFTIFILNKNKGKIFMAVDLGSFLLQPPPLQ